MSEGDETTARVRDMPAPRESKGLAGRAMARIFLWPHRVVLAGVYRAGFRPWQLTVLALTTNVVVGILLLRGDRLAPGLLLIVAGWFDVLDGAVARLRGEERRSGAFLDSVLDRVSDAILFGCLYWSLSGQGNELESALALVTLVTANRRRDKVPELEACSGTVDALRITLRVSTRLSRLSHTGDEGLSRELDEIGRMLGGWLTQSAAVSADTPEARSIVPDAPTKRPRAPVRSRMTSPQVERYLRAKLEHPQEIVFVRSGVFLQTFFEDAVAAVGMTTDVIQPVKVRDTIPLSTKDGKPRVLRGSRRRRRQGPPWPPLRIRQPRPRSAAGRRR